MEYNGVLSRTLLLSLTCLYVGGGVDPSSGRSSVACGFVPRVFFGLLSILERRHCDIEAHETHLVQFLRTAEEIERNSSRHDPLPSSVDDIDR
jgi:hypothetical protein